MGELIELLGLPALLGVLLAIARMSLVGLDVQWCPCQEASQQDCASVHEGGVVFRRGLCGVWDPQSRSLYHQGYLVAYISPYAGLDQKCQEKVVPDRLLDRFVEVSL